MHFYDASRGHAYRPGKYPHPLMRRPQKARLVEHFSYYITNIRILAAWGIVLCERGRQAQRCVRRNFPHWIASAPQANKGLQSTLLPC